MLWERIEKPRPHELRGSGCPYNTRKRNPRLPWDVAALPGDLSLECYN